MPTTQLLRSHMTWGRAFGHAVVWSHMLGWTMMLLLVAFARFPLPDEYPALALLAGYGIGGPIAAGSVCRSVKVAALFIPSSIAPTIELLLLFGAMSFSPVA